MNHPMVGWDKFGNEYCFIKSVYSLYWLRWSHQVLSYGTWSTFRSKLLGYFHKSLLEIFPKEVCTFERYVMIRHSMIGHDLICWWVETSYFRLCLLYRFLGWMYMYTTLICNLFFFWLVTLPWGPSMIPIYLWYGRLFCNPLLIRDYNPLS